MATTSRNLSRNNGGISRTLEGKSMIRNLLIRFLLFLACYHLSRISGYFVHKIGGGLLVGATACNISTGELGALEALYYSTNGSDWNWSSADHGYNIIYEPYEIGTTIWKFPASVSDPCSNKWQGITCNNATATALAPLASFSSCYVDKLELIQYNLRGSLPSNISELIGLSTLNLNYNSLTKSIPSQISALTRLSYLSLIYNDLTSSIPTDIYLLNGMSVLLLRGNLLSGNISCSISAMTRLSKLSLSANHLTGSICREFSNLRSLSFLSLYQNRLSHTIPSELAALSSLSYLDIYNNQLTGSIPKYLSGLNSLVYLFLSENRLDNTIPSELSTLTALTLLGIRDNLLTGSIPKEMSAMTNLTFLRLFSNSLSNSIPSQLSTLTKLRDMEMYSNFISGTLPRELTGLTALQFLLLNNNLISGTIFSEFTNLTSLQFLRLDHNKLIGSLPYSLSALTNLQLLYLQNNLLTNCIPYGMFSANLRYIDLSNNRLESTLPSTLSILRPTLVHFAAANNNLKGAPIFFLGYLNVMFVNLSYNSFDDFSIMRTVASNSSFSSSFFPSSLYNCPSLNYLDISNNYLTGSLPDSIGTVFHNLTLLSASNNRLLSYVPESLCQLSNLTVLLLSSIGNRSSYSTLIAKYFQRRIDFTIPSCLLQLPSLQTANLISNTLYGTIGEIGPNMTSLSLVGNLLTGTISKSIQTSSSKLNSLQLSINRISGTLVDDAFLFMNANSKIELYSNRISGNIPSSINKFVDVDNKPDILTGNVFDCNNNKAPSNIEDASSYSCGSTSIDFYQYVYLCVGIALVLLVFVLVFWKYQKSDDKRSKFRSTKKKKTTELFMIYFQHRPFPTPFFRGLVSPQFILASTVIALLMSLLNVSYSAIEKNANSSFKEAFVTVFYRYGWTSTFVYVHGLFAFVLVVLGLSTLLSVYLLWFDMDSTTVKNSSTVNNGSKKEENKVDDKATSRFISSTECLQYASTNCKSFVSTLLTIVDTQTKRWLLALQLLNVIAITGVNIAYIIGANSNRGIGAKYKRILPIFLSIFKFLWANTFAVYVAKLGIRSKLPVHVAFVNYVFALVYLFILVPIVTVYFTDLDCFYYPAGFGKLDPITESYPSIRPEVNCNCDDVNACLVFQCPVSFIITDNLIKYVTPTWTYGYHCGDRILSNYVPLVLSSYTIKGIILPVLKLFVLSFPSNSKIRNLSIVKLFLLPFTVNALSEKDLGIDEDREFRTLDYLSNLVTDLLILFTYGILCPFLTFLVLWSIVINEIIDHMQVGSYVYDMATSFSRKAKQDEIQVEKVRESEGSNRSSSLSLSVDIETDNLNAEPTSPTAEIFINVSDTANTNTTGDESINDLEKIADSGSINPTTPSNLNIAPKDTSGVKQTNNRLSVNSTARILKKNNPNFSVFTDLVLFENRPSLVTDIETQFLFISRVYMENSSELVIFVWRTMVIIILLFMSLVLYDFIADVYGNVAGFESVIVFSLFTYLLFGSGKKGLDRIISCFKKTRTCEILDDNEEENGDRTRERSSDNSNNINQIGVEMKSVSENHNPMVQSYPDVS